MNAKVLKPIPGTGYSIGDVSEFDTESKPWLLEGEYIEESKGDLDIKPEKPKPETATKSAPENATKNK